MQGRGEKWEASNEAAVIGTVRKRREIENQKKKREEENMSLKNNKYARRLAAALMTGAMMVSMMGMTAMAQEPAAPTEEVHLIKKILNKDDNLYSPKVNFEFTIEPAQEGECGTITGTAGGSVKVVPGPAEGVLFGVNGETSTTGTIESNPEKGSVTDTTVELGELSIVINENKFEGVGIYRYRITEKDGEFPGVTYDTVAKYLDVHVTNGENGGYSYTYTIIKGMDGTQKDYGIFSNTYSGDEGSGLFDLKVVKNVEGNQADLKKDFTFAIKVDSDVTGEKFNVVVYNSENQPQDEAKTVVGDDTNAVPVELGNGDYVVIYGLSSDDVYTVTETDYSGEGYLTKVDGVEGKMATGKLTGDTTVTFTNIRNADTPTGVILNIAPYILMVALAGVLAFFFLRKRHYEM